MAVNKYTCTMCGKSQNESNFYLSKSDIYKATGKLPICKSCMGELYDSYYKKYGNEKLALYYLCRKLDVCYNISSYNGVMNEIANGKQTEAWRIYMTKLNSLGGKNGAGNTFDDSDNISDEEKEEILNSVQGEIPQDMIIKWGRLPKDDLDFLESNYYQWVTRHKCETRAEEILFEEICQMQLDIKKTRENGGDTVKKVEALQKLFTSANIRPLEQSAINTAESTLIMGTIISTIEKNEPCEFFDKYRKKEYSDYMGYKKYFNNWLLRPLKNLMTGSKDFEIDNSVDNNNAEKEVGD